MAVLSVQGLVKIYQHRRVVDRISLNVESGAVVGLLGPNGAGKTTTFYMTVGMIKPESGQVFLNDEDVTDYPMYIRARKGIGYLPQDASIFRKLSVRQNILAILQIMPGSDGVGLKKRADALLDELGIKHLAESRAAVLSGGERRRLEISRALAANPAFILLDEPFAGIDPLAIADIKGIITHLKNRGIGVLISDHNVRETLGVCDRAYIVSEGKVMVSGAPDKISVSEIARQNYLGEDFRL